LTVSPGPTEILFDKTSNLEQVCRLGDDPNPVRAALARLLDEAAIAVHHAGSDLDEVLAERILVLHGLQGPIEVRAEFLADAESLRTSVLRQTAHLKAGDGRRSKARIVAVRVVVRQDGPGSFASPQVGPPQR
jgi:hypothetical protein